MLELRIPITLGTIGTIKHELAETIGQVKSSHRIEASARALGFRTYASMLEAAKSGHATASSVHGAIFRHYLNDHGFNVEAIHLYRALARVAVSAVLEVNPRLSMRGYGFGAPHWNPDLKRFETAQEKYAEFARDRAEFLSRAGFDEFLLALAFVQKIPATKTVRDVGSYRLKHIAENMPFTTADGTTIGPKYVSNEAFVGEVHKSKATWLRVREINRLAGIVRLSYALPYDKDVQEVMRLIWTEDETELPPYVPYKKDVA